MAPVKSFSMSRLEGEHFASLSDRQEVKDRIAMDWDIRFMKRQEDKHGQDKFTVATYERNGKRSGDAHYAEVYKVLRQETADYVLVVDTQTGDSLQYPKAYIERAYKVFVLGEFVKASADVEALIQEGEPSGSLAD